MKKVKMVSGYLIVKFNARELKANEGTALGEFGVIDPELYTGCLDVDRSTMEYDDVGALDEAISLATGLREDKDKAAAEHLDAEEHEQGTLHFACADNGRPFKSLAVIRAELCNYVNLARKADTYKAAECIVFELAGFVHALEGLMCIPPSNAYYWKQLGQDILSDQTKEPHGGQTDLIGFLHPDEVHDLNVPWDKKARRAEWIRQQQGNDFTRKQL